jgi:hypothetical protein
LNNRSHFTVQRQMDFGLGTTAGGVTGWVARHLDLAPEILPVGVRAADMPRGQRSMAGSTVSITMGSVSSFRVNGFTGPGGVAQTALRELHSGGSNIVTDRAVQALDALDLVAAAPISPPANGAVYPATGRGRQFGEHMRQIAQLIRADVGLEAAATQPTSAGTPTPTRADTWRAPTATPSRRSHRCWLRSPRTSVRISTASPWC